MQKPDETVSTGDTGRYRASVFPPAGVVQVKDLTLSSDIALHDLDTKLKLVTSWLEKKHHVRLTLKPRRDQSEQPLVISHILAILITASSIKNPYVLSS